MFKIIKIFIGLNMLTLTIFANVITPFNAVFNFSQMRDGSVKDLKDQVYFNFACDSAVSTISLSSKVKS